MRKARILFINSESEPYMPSGRMATHGRQLAQAMHDSGREVRVFSPRFHEINERKNQLHEVIRLSGQNIIINEADHILVLKVGSLLPQRIQVYFIDNDEFFRTRKSAYCDENGEEFDDQVERCVFFARGVAETMRRLRWAPDIIYCQGWFAAIVPVIVKKTLSEYSVFRRAKIVYNLFGDTFKKTWPATSSKLIKIEGVTKNDIADIKDKPIDYPTLMKFAIKFSDGVVFNGEMEPSVVEYAKENEKPMLEIPETEEFSAERFNEFFDQYFPHSEEEQPEFKTKSKRKK